MTTRKTAKSKIICPLCKGTEFKKEALATYPMRLFDGKQVNIDRVPSYECLNCHHLVPTKAGAKKVNRCFTAATSLFF
jgi:YgiT-type zinc finger domain-containing protein